MVDIGNKIKELRTEQKMTQSDLAERLGVTKSSMSSYENGSRLPSYDILLKIARIFKVSTDILLGHGDKNEINLNVSGLTNEQILFLKTLIEDYRRANIISSLFDTFPDEIKAQINDYIETGNKKETLGIKSVGKAKITLKNSHCSYHLKTKKIK